MALTEDFIEYFWEKVVGIPYEWFTSIEGVPTYIAFGMLVIAILFFAKMDMISWRFLIEWGDLILYVAFPLFLLIEYEMPLYMLAVALYVLDQFLIVENVADFFMIFIVWFYFLIVKGINRSMDLRLSAMFGFLIWLLWGGGFPNLREIYFSTFHFYTFIGIILVVIAFIIIYNMLFELSERCD